MGNFMENVKDTMLNGESNVSVTENGAAGYRTTGRSLLDLNFAVASLRNATVDDIAKRFTKAFFEDKVTAMKWLFFARDVRGGLGERRMFRAVMVPMAKRYPEYITPVLSLVPEYGRWDDLWCLLDTPVGDKVIELVGMQLHEDIRNQTEQKPISLLAKWMPRRKSSSKESCRYARILCEGLNMTERDYRKTLSGLSRYLVVVEQQMSQNSWDGIDYQRVPSRANLIYNKAFLRHDEDRRREFLERVEKGEAKINAGTLFPHDIVNKYRQAGYGVDTTLEALWQNLPDTVQGCGNTMVVMDDSGSMEWVTLPGSSARPLEVANALAIYFAERSSGQFKDQYMSFSDRPQLIDISCGKNLYERLQIVHNCHAGANTNVEAVFDLILETAISKHMDQADLPANILIISDMEFDNCASCGAPSRDRWAYSVKRPTVRLFDEINKRYQQAGYKMPRLVFWNVASRTGTIPVRENDMGVALVSGFSVNIAQMVMSGKLDPYECLLETLNTERYQPVEDALRPVISD